MQVAGPASQEGVRWSKESGDVTTRIPGKPTNLVGNISLLIEHEHAVAVVAVEALRTCAIGGPNLQGWFCTWCDLQYEHMRSCPIGQALASIEGSGWQP